jgi:hypothetical protein
MAAEETVKGYRYVIMFFVSIATLATFYWASTQYTYVFNALRHLQHSIGPVLNIRTFSTRGNRIAMMKSAIPIRIFPQHTQPLEKYSQMPFQRSRRKLQGAAGAVSTIPEEIAKLDTIGFDETVALGTNPLTCIR